MIGSRLRRLRLSRGLTQKELAAPTYSHAYVSTIEAGRRRPSRAALEHFASKLGVDVEELTTGRPADLEARLQGRLREARIALSDGRLEEAEATFLEVGRAAKRFKLARIAAKAEEGRGLRLQRLGRPEEALEHYQRAEQMLSLEPPGARADAVAGRAWCLEALGDVRHAIHVLQSLLDTLARENVRDVDALVRLHASLLDAYLDAGLYTRAAESAAELDRLAPRLTDPLTISMMYMNVARFDRVQGDIEKATRSLQRAEDTYQELHLKTEFGLACLAKGYVLSREGDAKEARGQLEQALTIFEETADDKDLTRALNELARVERLEGRLDRARALLERSISVLGEGDTPILAWAHRELGLVLVGPDPAAAEKHFHIAIELYERSEQAGDIAVTYRSLGDLLNQRGDADGGCQAYRTGIHALEPRL